jgi:hypothetical protein
MNLISQIQYIWHNNFKKLELLTEHKPIASEIKDLYCNRTSLSRHYRIDCT